MPKCLIHAVRDYRTGRWFGGQERDPNVMTTRSGLAIKKVPFRHKKQSSDSRSPQKEVKPTTRNPQKKKKYPIVKYKSMSYMSFVTRFQISLRVPHLELAGVNPRETLECLGEYPCENRSDLPSDYDSESSNEWQTDDEYENDDVFLGTYQEESDFGLLDDNMSDDSQLDPIIDFDSEPKPNYDKNDNSYLIDSDSNESVKDFADLCLTDDCDSSQPESNEDVTEYARRLLESGRNRRVMLNVQPEETFEESSSLRCDDCNRTFATLSAFTAHLRSHHMKQKNKCDICGKIFTRSWLLKGHTRTHTGERPFTCPSVGCDKAFADKSNLRSHMLIHSVKCKNFSCQRCGRAFAQKRYLHKHMLEVCRLL
ncbi:zinc finger protein SNAI2-like [Mizuhopecten yessoensis]|uniref:Transcriptional repressor scratch 1 n=1 Tax=Mizuhopecten yessoensis TaxID=6573 RepID=A0A210R0I7_MIZYE|nr:zinc finger protein SNAI2-like [Mizuhopecten yessoensis]OWF54538.1 Transcriptional repressor scratch 1 [Mizuhopecten yessoensis]